MSWRTTTATARGAAHERDGRPNQDAVAVGPLGTGADPGDDDAVIAAVADGHGGARYVRSDRGAALAVRIAVDVAGPWWARHGQRVPDAAGERALADELMGEVARRWAAEVRRLAASEPFTPQELATAGGPFPDPLEAYGATLLLVVAGPRGLWLAQLGDGDIIVSCGDGRVSRPVPGDDRLVGGQTTSLALASAPDDVRVAVVPAAADPRVVLVATDGYGNSFADEHWYVTVAHDIDEQLARRGHEAVEQRLPGWLADSAHAGGDDVTLAVLSLDDEPSAPNATTGAHPGARPRRRGLGLLLAVGVAGAAAGGVTGWTARGEGDGEAAAAPLPTSSSAPATTTTSSTTIEAPVPERSEVVGGDGTVVSFTPDAQGPNPSIDRTDPTLPAVLSTRAGGTAFTIDGSQLRLRRVGQSSGRAVDLDDRAPGAIAWVQGVLWVLDAANEELAAVNPDGTLVAWYPIQPSRRATPADRGPVEQSATPTTTRPRTSGTTGTTVARAEEQ